MCTNEELAARLVAIEQCVQQCDRALRGANGDAGLVASVELLRTEQQHIRADQATLKDSFANEMAHLKELIGVKEERNVQWPQLLWRFIAPVATSIGAAWLTARLVIQSVGN